MQRTYTVRSLLLALVVTCTIGALIIGSLGGPTIALAAGTVSGAVFRDFNGNGIRDTNDSGVGGVAVTAYDAAGVVRGTATSFNTFCLNAGNPLPECTGANAPTIGSYSIDATGPGPYRIEFSGWPGYLLPSAQGTNNGTSVQFVSNLGSPGINMALQNPAEYCQDNPDIATNCYTNGDPLAAGPADARLDPSVRPSLLLVPFVPASGGPADSIYRATGQQIGATWGIAYQRSSKSLFTAAVLRRHVGFGPNGPGAIYRIDPSGVAVPSLLLDLNAPAYAALAGVPVGTITRDLSAGSDQPNRDAAAFDGIGKFGLGALSLSEDEETLWVMNMSTRNLLEIRVGVPAVTPTAANITAHPMPAVACTDGLFRPWAVKAFQGLVYVGGVCSGETAAPGTKNSDTSDLRAHIFSHDPAGVAGNFTPVLDFGLVYPRGRISQTAVTAALWKPWIDEWSDIGPPPAGWPLPDAGPFGQTMYPQPMVTAIEFDSDGSMILGMLDRAGAQLGNNNYSPNAGDVQTYEGVAGGDTIRLCRNPNAASGFTLEFNATCPDGSLGSGQNNNEGPGNGEFYAQDTYGNTHQEVTIGGLASHYGRRQLVATAFDPDPAGPFRSGGLRWFGAANGSLDDSYVVFGQDRVIGDPLQNRPSTMGKAAGLGDVELLCDQAPIQIGNRVWRDDDGDGIQDAGEPILDNVLVELYRNAVRIGTATTNGSGEYYFRSGTATLDADTTDNIINDGGIGIRPRTGTVGGASEYEIRIPNIVGGTTQAKLVNLTISPTNNDGSPNGDSRDSDGRLSGNDASYSIPYGDLDQAGSNNHTYDFGFVPADFGDLPDGSIAGTPDYNTTRANNGPSHLITTTLRIGAVEDGELDGQPSLVANGDDSAGALDDEDGVRLPIFELGTTQSVTVTVQNTTGSPATLYGFIDFDGDGTFDDLNEQESVAVPTGTNGELTLTFDVPPGANTTLLLGARFRLSTSAILGPNGPAPDGEVEDYLIAVLPYSLGNRVWDDVNNDGTLNIGELGVADVRVNLYYDINTDSVPDGASVATAITSLGGYYRFDNLIPASYVVEVELPAGYTSSTNGEEAIPNSDGDSNDNGTIGAVGAVRSGTVTLAAANEPITETDLGSGDQGAPNNQANMTVDFGIFRTFSLGNRVWSDLNNSGTIDAGEPGFASERVNLFLDADANGVADGAAIATTLTNATGYYRFDNLLANTYIVEVVSPIGYLSSTNGEEADPNSNNDSNDNGTVVAGANIRSAPVTVGTAAAPSEPLGEIDLSASGQGAPDAQANMTVDFGFFRLYSLGNRVWDDQNNNGMLEVGEPGFGGLIVNLYRDNNNDGTPDGVAVATTSTNFNGYYRFDALLADTYIVEVETPANYTSSTNGQEADPDSDGDSNDNGTLTVGSFTRSLPVTLNSIAIEPTGEADLGPGGQGAPNAQANMTVDFGFFRAFSLGNRVWNDTNNSGTLDGTEAGIASVTVNLYRDTNNDGAPDGAAIAVATTDTDGYYRFDNLLADTYIVEAVTPTGYTSSTVNAGDPDLDADDSDDNGTVVVGANIRTTPVTLGSAAVPAEPLGESDLISGQDAPDAQANMTVDFGFFRLLSLGDYIWRDSNNNGLIDGGELGIDNVNVELYIDTNGNNSYDAGVDSFVASDTTSGGGFYGFGNLLPGDYLVVLPANNFTGLGALVGHTSSTGGGSEPAPDVDADADNTDDNGSLIGTLGAGGLIASQGVTLTSGNEPTNDGDNDANSNLSVDFGVFILSGLGDFIWYDTDSDGVQDAGENGVPGVTVTLFTGAGTQVSSTITDGNGTYGFTGLTPGDYYVVFSNLPLGHNFTAQNTPGDDALDSDADVATGQSQTVTLGPNEFNPTLDAGIFQAAGLGNYVWVDRDGDGVQDADEVGVSGVVVNLLDGTGNPVDGDLVTPGVQPVTTTTSATGFYFFGGLVPANYQVEFVPPTGYFVTLQDTPGDDTLDSDASPLNGRSQVVTLGPGESNPTIDAGLLQLASLGNYVWEDRDRDGLQGATEPGIPNVVVNLLNGNGTPVDGDPVTPGVQPVTTTTDATGLYQFVGLIPGLPYQIEFVLPANYVFTGADRGGADDSGDSDAETNTGRTPVVTLLSGENNPTLDAGMYLPLSLGNLVWNDINNNGVVDVGEPGLANVSVQLYLDLNSDGLPDGASIATVTTDSNGSYLFENLAPGSYIVSITPPTGYIGSTGQNGSSGGPYEPGIGGNSDINNADHGTTSGSQINSGSISLLGGGEPTSDGDGNADSNLTIDFGLFQPASLGSLVWNDTDLDGIFDPTEQGVPGVTVTLYDANGAVIAVTVTSPNGSYQFDNLVPGVYQVGFSDLPPDTTFTPPNQGGNDGNDSDVDPTTGLTSPVTLVPGQNNPTIWAGIIPVQPTAISLYSFSAVWDGSAVLVRWSTTLELNTFGFRLLRSTTGQLSDAIIVTPVLILGEGRGNGGADYSWRDKTAQPDLAYSYWLEEVEVDGTTNLYGPASNGPQPSAGNYRIALPMIIR